MNTPNASAAASSSPPLFRLVIASRKATSAFNPKVIKAQMVRDGKKVELKGKHQTFIDIVETTAIVKHMLGVVRRRCGPDYILVTQDGLQLEDTPATQGKNWM